MIGIGQAGEMKLSNAGISVNDPENKPGRYAGRGGLGAVMGVRGIKAMVIDEESALKSTSWGMFQIMGFNHKLAGFDTIYEFIEYIKISEKNQLEAFFIFLRKSKCFKYLKSMDWAKFARCYNGSGFKKNGYDSKLKRAYFISKKIGGDNMVINEIERLYAKELKEAFLIYNKQ